LSCPTGKGKARTLTKHSGRKRKKKQKKATKVGENVAYEGKQSKTVPLSQRLVVISSLLSPPPWTHEVYF
jgi:hypothetical protein